MRKQGNATVVLAIVLALGLGYAIAEHQREPTFGEKVENVGEAIEENFGE